MGRKPQEVISAQLPLWLSALLFAILATPGLLGYLYTRDDLLAFHYPTRQFIAECYRQGDSSQWMPSLYSGFFLAGSGQAGTFHPLHIVTYWTLPFPWCVNVQILVAYPFMFMGTRLLLSQYVRCQTAVNYGCLLFALGAFNLLHFVHPNAVAVIAHYPWLILALDRIALTSSRWQRAKADCLLVATVASAILMGYPQYVWFGGLLTLGYLLRRLSLRDVPLAYFPRVLCLAGIGCLIGLQQILPTLETYRTSYRVAQREETPTQPPEFPPVPKSVHPINLCTLIVPYPTARRGFGPNAHESSFYLGAIPFVLLVGSLVSRDRMLQRFRRKQRWLLGLILLALLLGFFGNHILTAVPVVGSFRHPQRILALVQLLTTLYLAGVLAVYLRRPRPSNQPFVRVSIACAVTSLALSVLFAVVIPSELRATSINLAIGPVTFLLAAVVFRMSTKYRVAALISLTALDVGSFGLSYCLSSGFDRYENVIQQMELPTAVHAPQRLYMLGTPYTRRNQPVLSNLRLADGYSGLPPQRHLLPVVIPSHQTATNDSQANRLDLSLTALQLAAVDWVKHSELTGSIDGLAFDEQGWARVPQPRARQYFARSVRVTHNMHQEIRDLGENEVLVLDPADQIAVAPKLDPEAHVSRTSDRPGRIELNYKSTQAGLIVLDDAWHEGWRARLMEEELRIVRIFGDLLGIAVPPGQGTIRLSFQPTSIRQGHYCLLFGLSAWAIWISCYILVPTLVRRKTAIIGISNQVGNVASGAPPKCRM